MEEYSRKTNSKRNPGSKRNPSTVGAGVLSIKFACVGAMGGQLAGPKGPLIRVHILEVKCSP